MRLHQTKYGYEMAKRGGGTGLICLNPRGGGRRRRSSRSCRSRLHWILRSL